MLNTPVKLYLVSQLWASLIASRSPYGSMAGVEQRIPEQASTMTPRANQMARQEPICTGLRLANHPARPGALTLIGIGQDREFPPIQRALAAFDEQLDPETFMELLTVLCHTCQLNMPEWPD